MYNNNYGENDNTYVWKINKEMKKIEKSNK